jgi:hypothetical protein
VIAVIVIVIVASSGKSKKSGDETADRKPGGTDVNRDGSKDGLKDGSKDGPIQPGGGDWKEVISKKARFKVKLPGLVISDLSDFGGGSGDYNDYRFLLRTSKFSPFDKKEDPKGVLSRQAELIGKQQTPLKLGAYTGVEGVEPDGKEIVRVYVGDGIVYSLSVLTGFRTTKVDRALANQFFNSFQITN